MSKMTQEKLNQVKKLLSESKTSKEISKILSIPIPTINYYRIKWNKTATDFRNFMDRKESPERVVDHENSHTFRVNGVDIAISGLATKVYIDKNFVEVNF